MEIKRHPMFIKNGGVFGEWLIGDGYTVNVGDPIFSYIDVDGNHRTDLSEHCGVVTIMGTGNTRIRIGDLMYTVMQVVTPKPKHCYVYLMHDTTNHYFKIGMSNDPKYRERTLQSEKPTIDTIIAKRYPIRSIARNIEKALQNTYMDKHVRGEWYRLERIDVEHLIESLS